MERGGRIVDKRATIEQMKKLLEGRRVVEVKQGEYEWGSPDYPTLVLDDGSEVAILDGNGFPPITSIEREPYVNMPMLWEGDQA